MNSNSVYNKLLELKGKEISLSEFQDLLESSNRRNTIFVQWETNEGNVDYYEMYWDSAKYKGGKEGGRETKEEEGMVNLQGDGFSGDWRTLTYKTITEFRFRGKNYKIV